MVVKKLNVKGMHCPSCEVLVKDVLEDENVEVLFVSFKSGVLEISFDENKIDFDEVKELIVSDCGYQVSEAEEN